MLKKIIFKNYRCFENSEITFRDISIIVGRNNAGKSTIIEALRIIAAVVQKFKHTTYAQPPRQLNLPMSNKGIKVNIDYLKIDRRSIVYQYRERAGEVAEIIAYWDDVVIHVYISSDLFFATIKANGNPIRSKADANRVDNAELHIMPQIGLIREDEPMLSLETVKNHMATRLASRHFRNELYQNKGLFEEFKELAQATWPGLRVQDLSYEASENKIQLVVYDANYSAEIGLMGSGLQMWLQMVWFISRCPSTSTIVLDEPDVYMHPELQRKMLKVVQNKFKQTIIATHSIEIISAVEPRQIVTVDKESRKMRYADGYGAVQRLVDNLGSDYNLSLSKLGDTHKCIFVEGKDMKLLSQLHEKLYPNSPISLDQLPTVALGGWSRFDEALGAARLFYDETQGSIRTICILDRDYHSQKEIDDLYKKAEESHLTLHVWEKKEIENYILSPTAIFKLTGLHSQEYAQFEAELSSEIEKLKSQTVDGFLDQMCRDNPGKNASTNHRQAAQRVEESWRTLEEKLSICNGKDLISLINEWLRNRYHKSSSRAKLLKALDVADISDEIKDVIDVLSQR